MNKFKRNVTLIFTMYIFLLSLASAQNLKIEKYERQFEMTDERELPFIDTTGVLIFYEPGYESLATEVSQYLIRAKSIIKDYLGFEPITKWQVVLYKNGPSMLLSTPQEKYNWLALASIDEGGISWYLNQVEWWTSKTIEENIRFESKKIYWLNEGLSWYISWMCIGSLSKEEQHKTGLSSYLRGELAKFRIYLKIKKHREPILHCDLTKWIPFLEREDIQSLNKIKSEDVEEYLSEKGIKLEEDVFEDENIHRLTIFFWLMLADSYGKNVIPKFISEASKLNEPTGEKLVQILSKITDRDIKKMLTTFAVKDLIATADFLEKELIH